MNADKKRKKPGEYNAPGLGRTGTRRKKVDYSDGTAKLPIKELRLSGLLQVVPSPLPVKLCARA